MRWKAFQKVPQGVWLKAIMNSSDEAKFEEQSKFSICIKCPANIMFVGFSFSAVFSTQTLELTVAFSYKFQLKVQRVQKAQKRQCSYWNAAAPLVSLTRMTHAVIRKLQPPCGGMHRLSAPASIPGKLT